MKKFVKILLLSVLIPVFSGIAAPQKAEAVDPVTIAVLAPLALKAARIATPYVVRGLQCAGAQLVVIGKDMLAIFYLPLGIIQSTLGAPFGYFRAGVRNMIVGGVAPFKMVWGVVILPLSIFGIGGS